MSAGVASSGILCKSGSQSRKSRVISFTALGPREDRVPEIREECPMSLLVVLIILLLVLGGGGFYMGGPRVGGSLGGLILLILLILLLTGRL